MLLKNSDLWYSEYYMDDDVKLSLKIDEVLLTEQTPFQKLEMFRNYGLGRVYPGNRERRVCLS